MMHNGQDGRQYQGPVPLLQGKASGPPQSFRAVQGADGMYLVAVWTDQDRALVQELHRKLDVLLARLPASSDQPEPTPIHRG